jgi:hypothetical protein
MRRNRRDHGQGDDIGRRREDDVPETLHGDTNERCDRADADQRRIVPGIAQ